MENSSYIVICTILEQLKFKLFLEKRQQGRFAGFSIYISKSKMFDSSLCYKDGPMLPPLNFTGTCLQQGRYVIFYTERLNEITYPVEYQTTSVFIELCEVTVLGENNFFKYNLKMLCSNCISSLTIFPCMLFIMLRFSCTKTEFNHEIEYRYMVGFF